ncbi:phosphatase PAP2 family protein [Stenotrophomonas lactitubi]|uniref:phosphatase PAP2 family protein n=1 Tax=Stenotrophomonas lactitubi TaxID=2045214 RepID=UPI00204211B2|nr:phosphatase PAP2 family protein [Stenotrophomonas lactitubi]
MMNFWEGLSSLGDSRALLPLSAVLLLSLAAPQRPMKWRWAITIAAVALLTLTSKIAFMGWGVGIASLDFTGISGHAAMSSAIYPTALWMLACGRSQRPWAWALAGVGLALAIAVSRLPLHAHSVSEIVAGLILGLLATLAVLRSQDFRAGARIIRNSSAALAITIAAAVPLLLADLHTHDLVKSLATALSGRERALDRHDR